VRTTITLDPDVKALLDRVASERGMSFKETVNAALRQGLAPSGSRAAGHRTATYAMGAPQIDLTKALALAGQLEDDELTRKLAAGR